MYEALLYLQADSWNMSKSNILLGKSNTLLGKSNTLLGKSGVLLGKNRYLRFSLQPKRSESGSALDIVKLFAFITVLAKLLSAFV